MSDEQARGSIIEAELALDRDGKFLALRTRWAAAIGAYYSTDRPTIPLTVGARLPRQHLHLRRRSMPR